MQTKAVTPPPSPSDGLYRIVYSSKVREGLSEAEVSEIYAAGLERNAAANITGILLYDGRQFSQLIEGERRSCERLFARITNDPRHHSIEIVWEGPIVSRAYRCYQFGREESFDKVASLILKTLAAA